MSCIENYISAPFRVEKLSLYGDNADKFFRPALRSLLVNYSFVAYRFTVYYNKCSTLRLAVYQPLCVEVNRVHIHEHVAIKRQFCLVIPNSLCCSWSSSGCLRHLLAEDRDA